MEKAKKQEMSPGKENISCHFSVSAAARLAPCSLLARSFQSKTGHDSGHRTATKHLLFP